jgi:hypothetical protein
MPLGTVSRIEIFLETEVPLIRDEPSKGEVVALPGPSWNQIQDWLTQLGRLKVDLESRAPGAP